MNKPAEQTGKPVCCIFAQCWFPAVVGGKYCFGHRACEDVPSAAPVVTEPNYSDPTPRMLNDPLWNVIWEEIKHWDIRTQYDKGYSGATGNHVTAIYKAIINWRDPADAEVSEPVPDAVVSQPEGTIWRKIVERVATDAIELAVTRHDLIWDEDLEITLPEIIQDAIHCLTGDDIGCGTEEDANDPGKCAGAFVRQKLASPTPVVSGQADKRSLYRSAALAIERAVDIAEAQEILFDLALQPAPPSIPKAGETDKCVVCGFAGNSFALEGVAGRWHHDGKKYVSCELSAAPPLPPAQDNAMVKCFKVTRPDFGKKFCVYRDLQTIVDAEFDGSEVGDGVLIEITEMTDAELRALPDFEGW